MDGMKKVQLWSVRADALEKSELLGLWVVPQERVAAMAQELSADDDWDVQVVSSLGEAKDRGAYVTAALVVADVTGACLFQDVFGDHADVVARLTGAAEGRALARSSEPART